MQQIGLNIVEPQVYQNAYASGSRLEYHVPDLKLFYEDIHGFEICLSPAFSRIPSRVRCPKNFCSQKIHFF